MNSYFLFMLQFNRRYLTHLNWRHLTLYLHLFLLLHFQLLSYYLNCLHFRLFHSNRILFYIRVFLVFRRWLDFNLLFFNFSFRLRNFFFSRLRLWLWLSSFQWFWLCLLRWWLFFVCSCRWRGNKWFFICWFLWEFRFVDSWTFDCVGCIRFVFLLLTGMFLFFLSVLFLFRLSFVVFMG